VGKICTTVFEDFHLSVHKVWLVCSAVIKKGCKFSKHSTLKLFEGCDTITSVDKEKIQRIGFGLLHLGNIPSSASSLDFIHNFKQLPWAKDTQDHTCRFNFLEGVEDDPVTDSSAAAASGLDRMASSTVTPPSAAECET